MRSFISLAFVASLAISSFTPIHAAKAKRCRAHATRTNALTSTSTAALGSGVIDIGPASTDEVSSSTTGRATRTRSALSATRTASSSSTEDDSEATSSSSTKTKSSATLTVTTTISTATATETSDPNVKTFKVKDSYKGESFFDGFNFDTFSDPTHGNVNYVGKSTAFDQKLAYTQDDGITVMKVDNQNWVNEGGLRNSVRVSSKTAYSSGLIVLDLDSMPYGCGVWPAFWTVGDNWPYGGEIDILENVHNAIQNQYTLHTSEGCNLDSSKKEVKRRRGLLPHGGVATLRHRTTKESRGNAGYTFSGTVLTTDCNGLINNNQGCAIQDPNTASYGKPLNDNGGGMFASLLDDQGVAIWFFPRDSIPQDLANGKPQPSTWPSPKAFWASTTCPSNKFFSSQRIVINTTLCGDWAGSVYPNSGCPGTCAQRVQDPANFDTAQWKIRSVIVYE